VYERAPLTVGAVVLWPVKFIAKLRFVILRDVLALLQLMIAMSKSTLHSKKGESALGEF